DLHEGAARRERALDDYVGPLEGRLRRRPLHDAAAFRVARHVERKWRGGIHGAANVVGDVEQIEQVERFFARLHHDARLGADDDLPGDGGRGRGGGGRRLDGGAGRDVVELRPPAVVGFDRLDGRSDMEVDRMAGDVVRQLTADQA